MMIKKLFFIVAVSTMLCACSNANRVENNSLDTASVVSQVSNIYNDVFKHYAELKQQEGNKQQVNNDSLYCSADWNRWIARVDSLNQLNGSIDILDVDHWIMGQDWGELSVSDIKVFLLKGDSAAVEFQLHNLGNMINVVLDMVHEDGEWKIDNFTDITNGMDWKATMKRYLEDEQANR